MQDARSERLGWRVARWLRWTPEIACFGLLVFQVWATTTWTVDDAALRAIIIGFTLAFVFLARPLSLLGRRTAVGMLVDVLLAAGGVGVAAYLASSFEEVFFRAGASTGLDLVVAAVAVVLTLEATRRTTGWMLPILSALFLLYPLVYGQWMPGFLRITRFDLERVLVNQYLSLSGILGTPLQVMITQVFLFIVFGSLMQQLGGIDFFLALGRSLAGFTRGGTAKTATLASAFMGSISGSAVANVVTTGTLTIPMMRREGFPPAFAAAVEAAASSGGQILPPIMGAAGFLMAEFTGTPYATIIKHALIPGILYYAFVYWAVDAEAGRLGMKPTRREDLARVGEVLRQGGGYVVPILVLTLLILRGYSLSFAAIAGSIAALFAAALTPHTRRLLTVPNLLTAVRRAVETAVDLFAAAACAGIVVGIVGLTGLGLKISGLIVDYSQGVPVLALFFTAIACIVLGMGLPTQIVYITVAVLVAPALVEMGFDQIAAHMFVLYYGALSMITPPVCLAAFAAAGIAGAPMAETGWKATRLALAGLLVPFYFVYNPGLLLLGNLGDILPTVVRAFVAIVAVAMALRYLEPAGLRMVASTRGRPRGPALLSRLGLGAVAVGMTTTHVLWNAAALLVFLLAVAPELVVWRRRYARANAFRADA